MRILDRLHISYLARTYECSDFSDAQHVADLLGLPHDVMYKTLVTKEGKGDYYVFVIPIDAELDLKKAARAVGVKAVSMIAVKEINSVTGYVRGGCTAVGMKKQYVTRVDESAGKLDRMIVSGGHLGVQIELRPDDLLRAAEASYADLCQ